MKLGKRSESLAVGFVPGKIPRNNRGLNPFDYRRNQEALEEANNEDMGDDTK